MGIQSGVPDVSDLPLFSSCGLDIIGASEEKIRICKSVSELLQCPACGKTFNGISCSSCYFDIDDESLAGKTISIAKIDCVTTPGDLNGKISIKFKLTGGREEIEYHINYVLDVTKSRIQGDLDEINNIEIDLSSIGDSGLEVEIKKILVGNKITDAIKIAYYGEE